MIHADDCDPNRARNTGQRFKPARTPWRDLWPLITEESLPDLPPPPAEPAVRIGVIDTGLVLQDHLPHPYVDGRVEFRDDDVDEVLLDPPTGADGHGTFVTGLILKEAPDAQVVMKGVLDKSSDDIEDKAVARAIGLLAADGITLINMSFSGSITENEPPANLVDTVRDLPEDVVIVAAAGNSGLPRRAYPGAIDLGGGFARIIAVGAADTTEPKRRTVAEFSAYGTWVDCFAPGVGLVGPYMHNELWKIGSGTSFAAAIVTGRIAALMCQGKTARQAAEALIDNATETITFNDVNGEQTRPFV